MATGMQAPKEKDKETMGATVKRLLKGGKKSKGQADKVEISAPKLDLEAAKNMSALNSNNYPPMSPRSLPDSLKQDINQFKLSGFATKYFAVHRKGIFRRRIVPMETMLKWTGEPIPGPMLEVPASPKNKNIVKDSTHIFKWIQTIMGDRSAKNVDISQGNSANNDAIVISSSATNAANVGSTSNIQLLQNILEKGLLWPELRDEIYVQLCRQNTGNSNPDSLYRGWQILSVAVAVFPPSRNLEGFLRHFIKESSVTSSDSRICTLATYALRKLNRTCQQGARARVPSLAELERMMDAAFHRSVFGTTLAEAAEISRQQEQNTIGNESQNGSENEHGEDERGKDESCEIPKILRVLTEAIIRLNGEQTEGIFRVPGDSEAVYGLKLQIEKGNYDITVTDPNLCASLLKLWLRELDEPLIPNDLYADCIQYCDDPQQILLILERMPQINRNVVIFVVKFLQQIAVKENQPFTKMTENNLAMVFAPSFLRCPSENPQTIFQNAKYEQNFVHTLIAKAIKDV